jgi:Ca-activated chloride channel family protein
MQCPAAKVTAYVSVTDQGGYAVTGLVKDDFLVYEDVDVMNLTDFSFVSQVTAPISVALVMDYSGSITSIPEAQSDMEEAVANFVNQLGADDEAEIVKFATEIEVVQGFTSDKNLLTNAIYNPVDVGRFTRLYDVAWQAVDDTALELKTRKAVIIVSDGVDEDDTGNPISSKSLGDVINHAKDNGVPIFTVGLGNINDAILEQMANDTGGQFFDSPASDNLGNIYSQIANVLFENQYILEYISTLEIGETADLKIEANVSQAVFGDDTTEISPCP